MSDLDSIIKNFRAQCVPNSLAMAHIMGHDNTDQKTLDDFFTRETNKQIFEGYKQAVKRVACDKFTTAIKRGRFDECNTLLAQVNMLNEKQVSPFMFITVNPKPTIKPEQLIKLVNKWCARKCVIAAVYTFEQAGEDDDNMGHHPHAHILMEHNMARSEFIRNIKNTFSQICNVNNDKLLNIRTCPEDSDIAKRYRYITGHKKDNDKAKKMEIDKIWRSKLGIDDFYKKGLVKNLVKNYEENTENDDSDYEYTIDD